jgi:hypothetical protein
LGAHGISTYLPQCINYLQALIFMGFCFYSWRLKVCSCSYRLKAFVFALGSWRFLSLLFKKLKVFAFECWRFLLFLLNVQGFCSYFWMLKVCDSWSFVYLHILKKNDVKIYSILFRSWMFSLTSNDERFMKGDFLMIIMLNMFCFVLEHLWWLLLFLCCKVELSLCFNPSTSKLCIQGIIISKIPKIVIQLTWL